MMASQLSDLTGKTALITGGSRGLGLQIAEALGEAGARLVISSRKAADLEEAKSHLEARGAAVDYVVATKRVSGGSRWLLSTKWWRVDRFVDRPETERFKVVDIWTGETAPAKDSDGKWDGSSNSRESSYAWITITCSID